MPRWYELVAFLIVAIIVGSTIAASTLTYDSWQRYHSGHGLAPKTTSVFWLFVGLTLMVISIGALWFIYGGG